MRSRHRSQDQVAEVARRRLEMLSAELAGIRPVASGLPDADAAPGPGEHSLDAVHALGPGEHSLDAVHALGPGEHSFDPARGRGPGEHSLDPAHGPVRDDAGEPGGPAPTPPGPTLLEAAPWPEEPPGADTSPPVHFVRGTGRGLAAAAEPPPHRLAPWPDGSEETVPHRLAPWPDGSEETVPPRTVARSHPGDESVPSHAVRPSADRTRPGAWPMAEGDAAPPPSSQPLRSRPGRHARRRLEAGALVGGWLHDRLPAPLQGRVRVGAAQLTVVAVGVALALAVTAWWVVRADRAGAPVPALAASQVGSTDTPAALVTPAAQVAGGSTAAASPAASASASLVVDVTGKVRHPGIVTLPVGSRVVDALDAAGGAQRGVRLDDLNLARMLTDGEQITVGVPAPGGVAAPAASAPTGGASGPTTLVNINTADQTQLETLPGVGPVTAQKILQWRADNGPFSAVDDLLDVSGIGDATLAELAPFVTL